MDIGRTQIMHTWTLKITCHNEKKSRGHDSTALCSMPIEIFKKNQYKGWGKDIQKCDNKDFLTS